MTAFNQSPLPRDPTGKPSSFTSSTKILKTMNKPKLQASKAFSLIELSIVILIVGIIIAGITQSSRLVRQSKIKSAQSITQASPVNGVKGISLWLEPTQEASFASALDDEANLTQWNDINTQTQSRFFAIPASGVGSSDNIKYEIDGINGLPSIKFSGANTGGNGALAISTSSTALTESAVNTNSDPNAPNAFTAFVVYKFNGPNSSSAYTLLNNGVNGTNGWGYFRASSTAARNILINGTSTAGSGTMTSTQEIATITYTGSAAANSRVMTLYINGGTGFTVANATSAATAITQPATRMFIGGQTASAVNSVSNPWNGLISEVIIFDTVLSTQDLKDVTNYLSKKYNIAVSL